MVKGLLCLIFGVTSMVLHSQVLYPVRDQGKWGFIDSSGKLVIGCTYDQASDWENGFARARTGSTLYLVFSPSRILQIENCSDFRALKHPWYKAHIDHKWWICDSNGIKTSDLGYDRIWQIQGNDSFCYVTSNGRMGVARISGGGLFLSVYDNLKQMVPGFYAVWCANRTQILINSSGNVVVPDSFLRLKVADPTRYLFTGMKPDGVEILFDFTGKILMQDEQIRIKTYTNEFLEVQGKNTGRFCIDQRTGYQFPLTRNEKLRNSLVANSVIVDSAKKVIYYFRNSGWLRQGNQFQIISTTPPYLFRDSGLMGLMDENMKVLLRPIYINIQVLPFNQRYLITARNSKYYFLNANTLQTESDSVYFRTYSQPSYCKAYRQGNGMDYYEYDSTGKIISVTSYENVLSMQVDQRLEYGGEDWITAGDNTYLNPLATSNPLLSGNRTAGWFSKWSNAGLKYGLIVGRNDTAIPARFDFISVLNTAPYSLAGYSSGFRSKGIQIMGRRPLSTESALALFNDSTGTQISSYIQYFDVDDLYKSGNNLVRIIKDGKMYLFNVQNRSTLLGSTYISSMETRGLRRVYIGGYLQTLLPRTVTDRTLFDEALARFIRAKFNEPASIKLDGGQWMLADNEGKVFKPKMAGTFKVIRMEPFDKWGNSILLLSSGKWGMIDSAGNTVIQPVYDMIAPNPNVPGLYQCGKAAYHWGMMNRDGEVISEPKYDNIVKYGDAFVGNFRDSTYLFADPRNASFIGHKMRMATFSGNTGFIRQKRGYQVCRTDGEIADETKYRNTLGFSNGHAPVSVNGFWGLIDANGQVEIPMTYREAKSYQKTAAIFKKGNHFYFYEPSGSRIKGPMKADAVSEITDGIFMYQKKDKYALYNREGKVISHFHKNKPVLLDSLIAVCLGSLTKFYNLNGELLDKQTSTAKLREMQLTLATTSIRRTRGNSKCITFELNAAQLRAFGATPPYRSLSIPTSIPASELFQKNYWYEAYLNDIFLSRNINHMIQFVDGNNEPMFGTYFSKAEPMHNQRSICTVYNGKTGVLDPLGFWIVPPAYNAIKQVNDSMYTYCIGYEYDLFDKNGFQINTQTLDQIEFKNNLIKLHKGNGVGYLNRRGKMVWQLTR